VTKAEEKQERKAIQEFLAAFHEDPDGVIGTWNALRMAKLFMPSAASITEARVRLAEAAAAGMEVVVLPMERLVCEMLVCGFLMGRAFEQRHAMEKQFEASDLRKGTE